MKNFIANRLSQDFPGQKWAFVQAGSDVHFSVFPEAQISYAMSPVICLLQQIFETKKDHSFFILRKAIVTNYEPGVNEKGMVKVVAKRIQQGLGHPIKSEEDFDLSALNWQRHQPRPLASLSELHHQPLNFSDTDPKVVLQQLVQMVPRGQVLHDYDRPIAAVLVNSEGLVIEFGVNSNHINKTLHAEVNLLQRYFEKHHCQLPLGSKIFVTHKPCKMCAGMIWEALQNRQSEPKIFFLEEVLGALSQNTVLDGTGLILQI